MMQQQYRGGSNAAPLFLILGGVVGVVAEAAMDVAISSTVKSSHLSVYYVLGGLQGLVIGVMVGGAALLGRARHYGLAAVAGPVALVAAIIGDLLSRPVVWSILHLPLNATMFTSYFTGQTVISLLLNLVPIATAAGLTAVGVSRTMRTLTAAIPPQGPWNQPPPYGPPQPTPGMGAPPYAPPGPPAGGPPPQGWQPPAGPGGPPPSHPPVQP
ncbi:hypothetical protein NE236_05535 [Actinoallomurus purpureus]|uniref:hypothetical protein n=1 Tax=Actinoallomurus purpureus TaxID=478114 RepID=UPI0020930A34|nr:hypothetical protein [Actinoallomurus purpureus]MCO6004439.1 hypothetical protein [Actinoallomurus purpureus]